MKLSHISLSSANQLPVEESVLTLCERARRAAAPIVAVLSLAAVAGLVAIQPEGDDKAGEARQQAVQHEIDAVVAPSAQEIARAVIERAVNDPVDVASSNPDMNGPHTSIYDSENGGRTVFMQARDDTINRRYQLYIDTANNEGAPDPEAVTGVEIYSDSPSPRTDDSIVVTEKDGHWTVTDNGTPAEDKEMATYDMETAKRLAESALGYLPSPAP